MGTPRRGGDEAVSLRLELDDDALDGLAERIAERMQPALPPPSPWMDFGELVDYTKIREGTLRKLTAEGRIPSHSSGRAKLYHRDEVDEALLGYSRRQDQSRLRRVS
jgi:excisionase family DNA binding protein